jgi:thymidylate synthase (FAD)
MNKTPKTFLVGVTQPDWGGLAAYLEYTDQKDFLTEAQDFFEDYTDGKLRIYPGNPLCLVSFYAKLCYKSLVEGKNANVTKIRAIEDNLISVLNSGHGSVFEHVWLNFVTTDCSRVFTHELVRHRVGTAFSQTSGRYVSIDEIDFVLPPDLMKHEEIERACHAHANITAQVCRQLREALIDDKMPFADKKRITSAIRRLAPNGQTNEIGWSCNVRALRHMIEMRTSRHAEWEIRVVFNEVAKIVEERWPLMLYSNVKDNEAKWEEVDGLREFKGLKV